MISIYAGRDLTLTFGPIVDLAGNNIDMTGGNASWWLGRYAGASGADVFVMKTLGHGLALTQNAGAWSAVITLIPADTESITPTAQTQSYYHELEVKDSTGGDYTFQMTDKGLCAVVASLIPPL